MTLTRELRTSVAFILAILLALTAFVWGNQRLVHAQEAPLSMAEQINCFIEQGAQGSFNPNTDYCGGTPPGESPDPSLAEQIICYLDWVLEQTDPNLPFDPQLDYCDMPPPPAPQCDDGIDNDSDGLIDFPADPGCTNADDDTESPNPPPLFQCMDSIDNDSDGLIDFPADPGCTDIMDNDESNGGGGGGSGADIAVSKAVSDTTPAASTTVTYTITVTSTGPDSTNNLRVTDMLPAGVSYVSDSGSGAYATTTGVWTIGTMGSGSTTSLTIEVIVMATTGVQVTNTASVSNSSASDSNSGNDTSSVSFVVTEDGQGGGGGNPQCSDGIDNDGDGDIDYPADDDCESASDDKEEQDSRNSGGGSRRNSGGSSNNNAGEVLGAQAECPMYLTGYIKYGAANDAGEVAKLQVFLNNFEGASLPITGTYGPQTLAAVNAFQNKYAADILAPWGMKGASGYVYYTTQKQINTIYCKFQKDFPLSITQIEEIAHVREIQPTLRAQGAGSMGGAQGTGAGAAAPALTSPAVGSVVLPQASTDENAGLIDQTAATSNASSTQGWFTKFVNWLFGR